LSFNCIIFTELLLDFLVHEADIMVVAWLSGNVLEAWTFVIVTYVTVRHCNWSLSSLRFLWRQTLLLPHLVPVCDLMQQIHPSETVLSFYCPLFHVIRSPVWTLSLLAYYLLTYCRQTIGWHSFWIMKHTLAAIAVVSSASVCLMLEVIYNHSTLTANYRW